MTNHFNGLSPAEAERLAWLAEECGEVVQAIGKILRHGYDSTHPKGGMNNREYLSREVGDLQYVITLLMGTDISVADSNLAFAQKKARLIKYSHHQVIP